MANGQEVSEALCDEIRLSDWSSDVCSSDLQHSASPLPPARYYNELVKENEIKDPFAPSDGRFALCYYRT